MYIVKKKRHTSLLQKRNERRKRMRNLSYEENREGRQG